jgi:hypothetical protein
VTESHDAYSAYSGDGELLPRISTRKGSTSGRAADGVFDGDARPGDAVTGDVGDFRRGNLGTQWALGRYLVGRVIVGRVQAGLLFSAVLILILAGLVYWAGITWLAVLIALAALGVIIVRWLFITLVGRLIQAPIFGPFEDQLRRLVGDTRGDLRRELHRIGVPAGWWSFPLLIVRLMRRTSRRRLFERMRTVDLGKVVPASRVDELHLLIDSVRRVA